MTPDELKRLAEAIEGLTFASEKNATVPDEVKVGVGAPIEEGLRPSAMSEVDRLEIRRRLRKLSYGELWQAFGEMASKRDAGIPVDAVLRAGGRTAYDAFASNPTLTKALDTSASTALQRQDLEPLLYELYIREFPAWERFSKEPSNGLVHAYNRQTDFGDAQFMTELGTVTDDVAAYERATTPISVIATRRGVTLKNQYAVLQGGAGFNPEQLEMRAGLRAIAYKMQKTIFQGNATASGGTGSTEYGAYDVNGFDGLRKTLWTANAEDVNPEAATPEIMRDAFNDAAITVMQNAGRTGVIYIDPIAKGQFDTQQDQNVRYNDNLVNVGVGVLANTVNTVFGPLPMFVVPGDSIGSYTRSGTEYSDAYLIDESAISLPYLGSDGPQVIEIPMGVSGQLTRLFIIFGMWGMAVKAVQFHNKVRIKRP